MSTKAKKYVWFTWERQRRNIELSKALGCSYFEFNYDGRSRLIRYPACIIKTIIALIRERADIVFGQNPSILLVVVLTACRRFFGYRLIVDAHNSGIRPMEGRYKLLNSVSKFVQKRADMVIVHNEEIKRIVKKNGGKAFVLQDKIPDLKLNSMKEKLDGKYNFLYICKFHSDEPYFEVFEAAKKIPKDISIYVTGNFKKKLSSDVIENLGENVKLMGFIPEHKFIMMLNSVDATIDLTTREDCLVCGAYESVGVEKPMLLSKSKSSMEYFRMGTIFVDNRADDIVDGIIEYINNSEHYKKAIVEGKNRLKKSWNKRFLELLDRISSL